MRVTRPLLASALTVVLVTACQPAANVDGKPSKAETAFGESVREYLLAHPEVIEEAVSKLNEQRQVEAAAERDSDAKRLIPPNREALERDARDLVVNPNGKITVVEFFDYNCGYCKSSAPEILDIAEKNPDIRLVLKELPIFGEASDTAAKVALTPAGKAKGVELFKAFMAQKPLDEAAIDRILAAHGLDPAAVRKAAASPEVEKQIADVRALAVALKIQGTPAFVVGDVMIPGADMAALRAAITQAKAADIKPAGAAAGG
jgi:protein-disulfide isomerase